jgi:arginine decarboxylase
METRTVKKAANRVKSTLRRLEGSARKRQDAAPIGDAIRDYWDRGMLSFSIPAHGGGRGPVPEFATWAGLGTARADLPTSHGLDTRDRAWKVRAIAQQLFAEAIGAKQTLFSTNGSSLNARVAIMTVAGPGETLVMARNGHKSAFSGLILSGARPAYVDPVYDDALEIALGPLATDVAAGLDAHRTARAALVFTPSYYGTTAAVGAIAEVCHERDRLLVTDDAWGLDYTSVLSVGSDRIDVERLKLASSLKSRPASRHCFCPASTARVASSSARAATSSNGRSRAPGSCASGSPRKRRS